jgi:hypothetical protein
MFRLTSFRHSLDGVRVTINAEAAKNTAVAITTNPVVSYDWTSGRLELNRINQICF